MSNNSGFCQNCGTRIPNGANACPRCGARIKKKFSFLDFLILLVSIALLIFFLKLKVDSLRSIQGGGYARSEKASANATATIEIPIIIEGEIVISATETETSEPTVENIRYGLGQTATQDNISMTLVSVTESEGTEFLSPQDGNIYVVCEFEIENNSSKELTVGTSLSFKAYFDDYLRSESVAATYEINDKEKMDSSVAPGKKIDGVIGYEVPKDWKELEIRFNTDFWSRKDIIFVAKH